MTSWGHGETQAGWQAGNTVNDWAAGWHVAHTRAWAQPASLRLRNTPGACNGTPQHTNEFVSEAMQL